MHPMMPGSPRKSVVKQRPSTNLQPYIAASPVNRVPADAPPLFVLHGRNDSLVPVEQARGFVDQLRQVSKQPVVYAELPFTQHAFDIFGSARARTQRSRSSNSWPRSTPVERPAGFPKLSRAPGSPRRRRWPPASCSMPTACRLHHRWQRRDAVHQRPQRRGDLERVPWPSRSPSSWHWRTARAGRPMPGAAPPGLDARSLDDLRAEHHPVVVRMGYGPPHIDAGRVLSPGPRLGLARRPPARAACRSRNPCSATAASSSALSAKCRYGAAALTPARRAASVKVNPFGPSSATSDSAALVAPA